MRHGAVIPGVVFRYLCLLTAVANMGGNVGLILFYTPIFTRLGVPIPSDLHLFTLECVLSFTMGVVALLIFLDTSRAIGLLAVGIVGKGSYAAATYYFYAVHGLHWFFLVFAIWDAVFVVLFFLYWIQLAAPDVLELQQGVFDGIDNPQRRSARRALLIGFSLTGNGSKSLQALAAGLAGRGYEVDIAHAVPVERIYRFPMSFLDFVRIIARAFFRKPGRIAPLRVPEQRDWDLVAVESPTWLIGMAGPVESVFLDPANRALFRGRDAAAVVVCRGAYQRNLAMIVRHLERAGANIVAARGWQHQGWEPRRLMSLWFYLIFRREGFPPLLAEPHYGLSGESLAEIERFGCDLADRPRTRPHWTLLLDVPLTR
jgi:hypothetical protein